MPTVVIGNNTGNDYSGVSDAQITEYQPGWNWGARDFMEMTNWGAADRTHTLIKFTGLSSIAGPVSVSAATLYMYCYSHDAGSRTATFKRLLMNWTVGTQTGATGVCSWYQYATSSNWYTAGAMSDGNDRDADASATMTMSATGWMTASGAQMTTDVDDFIDGTVENYGWEGERTDGGSYELGDAFRSSDYTDGYRPYLSATYTESGGSSPVGSILKGKTLHSLTLGRIIQ